MGPSLGMSSSVFVAVGWSCPFPGLIGGSLGLAFGSVGCGRMGQYLLYPCSWLKTTSPFSGRLRHWGPSLVVDQDKTITGFFVAFAQGHLLFWETSLQ